MSEGIHSGQPHFLKNHHFTQNRLSKTMSELSTGFAIQRPGDSPVATDKISSFELEKHQQLANMVADQSRISWYQTSTAYLQDINDILTSMQEIALRAKSDLSPQADRDLLDSSFQSLKGEISQVVDGEGGAVDARGTFNSIPLFLGFAPDVVIGKDAPLGSLGLENVNLYTGFKREGFSTLPLVPANFTSSSTYPKPSLSGTADGGSTTTVTLDVGGSSISDIYQGMTFTVDGGTGAGQSATILSYDGETRTATFTAPLTVALDNSSTYTIESNLPNSSLQASGSFTSVRVAEGVWGADNDRSLDDLKTFRSLTVEERDYRTLNAIPDTDLEPKTYQEKIARRKVNIFDQEFGRVNSREQAEAMFDQISRAVDQVSRFIVRESSKVESLQQQYQLSKSRSTMEDEGISAFKNVDAFKASSNLSELLVDNQKILELASRLNQNVGKLNSLVQNKGKG